MYLQRIQINGAKEKSRKLKNVFFKSASADSDLQKIIQVEFSKLNEKLDLLNKNILYITYKVDKISKFQATLDSQDYYEDKESEQIAERGLD